ncbi:DM13 domain-containing protein [Leptolyngbya sp. FACHB-261]|uniref:DM13 domain-containing protein n=1 Tax=Leptolyngbya sp. FACHB-261 TaxID=2692806 RepID=UPI0016895CE7|nr:DM13 domain-containing protein [Leptolyngbya sp. FACHB-261]MBD2105189.1 DM13 domain-containing protein [Leptolyngbya sp. FACHB-261]
MRFNQLIILVSTLILSIGCAREVAIDQPASEAANPSPSAEVTASTDPDTFAPEPAAKSGTFVAGEAPTEGIAQIVAKDGERYLELNQAFKTSDQGPDLFVILHRSDDVLGSTQPPAYPLQEQDYVILGPLKSTTGAQRYPVPEDVNLEDYKSAVIWCRQFNATFGVAKFDS